MKTIRARIFLGISIAGMALLVLATLNMYGVHDDVDTLDGIRKHHIDPMAALQAMDHTLLEINFLLLSQSSDKAPASCTTQELKAMHSSALAQWRVFKESVDVAHLNSDASVKDIESRLELLTVGFDTKSVVPLAENDSLVRGNDRIRTDYLSVLVSIRRLMEQLQWEFKGAYEKASAGSGKRVGIGFWIFAVTLVILFISAVAITNEMLGGVRQLDESLTRIGQGDLRFSEAPKIQNEFGHLVEIVEKTSGQLRGIIGNARDASDRTADSSRSLFFKISEMEQQSMELADSLCSIAAANEELIGSLNCLSEFYKGTAEASLRTKRLTMECVQVGQTIEEAVTSHNALVRNLSMAITKLDQQQLKPPDIGNSDLVALVINIANDLTTRSSDLDKATVSLHHLLNEAVAAADETLFNIKDQVVVANEEQLLAATNMAESVEQLADFSYKHQKNFVAVKVAAEQLSEIAEKLRVVVGQCRV